MIFTLFEGELYFQPNPCYTSHLN